MARSKLAAEMLDTGGSDFAGPSTGRLSRAAGPSTSLTLRPLLAPFKGRGRLFLRLEKLPQRATLSAGKRNSDGSWSLASDELDDVTYHVPPQAAGDHVLTIRVTALDGGEATTLKVLDFPVSFRTPAAPVANQSGVDQQGGPLAQMQSMVALREAEMALLHAQLEQEQRERARDAVLIEQRLKSAFDQILDQAAHRHQQELEAERAAFGAEIAELAARVPGPDEKEREAELMRHQLQKDFDQRLAKAAAQHQQELEAQRTALQAKIAELTARIPAQSEKDRDAEIIRQHLQKDFDARLASAALQHRQALEAERAALQAQIAGLTSRLPAPGERERDAERIRQELQADFDQRLAEIAARHLEALEDDRAALQAEIAGLTARAEASERRLQEQASRAAQDQEHGQQAAQQLEDIRRAAAAEAEENLRSAHERWTADLTRMVREARQEWSREQDGVIETLQNQHEALLAGEREKTAKLEAALARAAAPGEDHSAAALSSLSDQLVAAGRALADRERELEEAKAQLDKERAAHSQVADQKADQLLQQERGNWRAQENALREQLSALQAQADAQIASLTARCREAEARTSRNSWGTAIKDKARIDALTLEVQSLRTALAKQASGPAHDRPSGGFQTAANLEEPKEAGRSKKVLLRDFAIAVCCITPLILLYPYAKSFVHDFMSDDPPAPLAAAAPKVAVPLAAKPREATVVRGVNMRKTASAKGDVVFTLKKGVAVEILSTAGKWTEVGVKRSDGAQTRGWVFNTYLQADGTN